MFNSIRSIDFSTRKDKSVLLATLFMAVIPYLLMMFLSSAQEMEFGSITASYYFASQNMAAITVFFYFAIVVIACRVFGADFSDKTINYEILSGHNRSTVFFSRVVVGVIRGAVIPLILTFIPLCVFAFLNGWGQETERTDVIVRTLLVFFPLVRICALNIMFAGVSGSAGKGIALGFLAEIVMSIVQSLIEEGLHITVNYAFGIINIMLLLTSQNSREIVVDGKPVSVFETAVTTDMVLKTVGVSLGFTAAYLMIAYYIFRKKDRS